MNRIPMYRSLCALLSVAGAASAVCAQPKTDMNSQRRDHKILVAYFSATGTTARAAEKLANFPRLNLPGLTRLLTSTGTTVSRAVRRR